MIILREEFEKKIQINLKSLAKQIQKGTLEKEKNKEKMKIKKKIEIMKFKGQNIELRSVRWRKEIHIEQLR